MMSWSAVAIAQAGIQNRTGFFVTRALLGLIEGGFIADTILYLSYFYTSTELTIRLAFFWVSYTVTNIVGALLAAGILEMRHHTHMEGWRWLFALEGALTFLVGLFALFYLPPSPTQTHQSLWGRIRGQGWFTEREEIIVVNKVLRDDPTKSSSESSRWQYDIPDSAQCITAKVSLSATCGDLSPTTIYGLCTSLGSRLSSPLVSLVLDRPRLALTHDRYCGSLLYAHSPLSGLLNVPNKPALHSELDSHHHWQPQSRVHN